MDERLKEKLELLGEPALPDSLTAEELFRRIDCGELVLPEETEVEAEAAPSDNVIPWAKILRRGVPIAACLALVVFIAQGKIWKMGSSGGNFSGNAAAPQAAAAADQSELTNGSDGAPMESYSLDDEAETPEPFRSIAIEEDDQEAETTKGAAADDIAEEDVFDDIAEEDAADAVASAEHEPLRPDTGGDDLRPDSGGDLRPDIWVEKIGEDDADTIKSIWHAFNEVVPELSQQDETLAGMIPFNGLAKLQYDTYDDVTAYFPFGYELYKIVTYRAIRCSIARGEDGEFHVVELFSFEEWEPD